MMYIFFFLCEILWCSREPDGEEDAMRAGVSLLGVVVYGRGARMKMPFRGTTLLCGLFSWHCQVPKFGICDYAYTMSNGAY